GVALLRVGEATGGGELGGGELAHALVEAEAPALEAEQRFVPKALEEVEEGRRPGTGADHARRRLEGEAAAEDRRLQQRLALGGREQVERAGDRLAERGVPPEPRALEDGEAIGQAREQRRRRQHPHPRRGELDREGDPIEALDEIGDRRLVARLRGPVRPGGARPRLVEALRVVVGERADLEDRLAGDAEAHPGGGEDLQGGGAVEPRVEELEAGGYEALEVVEDEERRAPRGEGAHELGAVVG